MIPADINRQGALGSNALIRDGLGKLIITAQDILNEYEIADQQLSLLASKPEFDDPLQATLYDILCRDTQSVDALVEIINQEAPTIINALAMMEIEGIVINVSGGWRVN